MEGGGGGGDGNPDMQSTGQHFENKKTCTDSYVRLNELYSTVHVHIVKQRSYYIFMTLPNPSVTNTCITFDYRVLYCEKRVEMSTNGVGFLSSIFSPNRDDF
jgi:hypothetical protein